MMSARSLLEESNGSHKQMLGQISELCKTANCLAEIKRNQ